MSEHTKQKANIVLRGHIFLVHANEKAAKYYRLYRWEIALVF